MVTPLQRLDAAGIAVRVLFSKREESRHALLHLAAALHHTRNRAPMLDALTPTLSQHRFSCQKSQRSLPVFPESLLLTRAEKGNWEQVRHLIFHVETQCTPRVCSLRQGCGSSERSARRRDGATRVCGPQRESRLPSRCAQAGCLLVHVGVPTPAGCACRHPLVVNCTLCCGPCDCMSQFDTGLL